MSKPIKVEIWSDVMCPFCYIGKRKFEQALRSFHHKDLVDIEWKAFQLDPDMKTLGKPVNVYQYLSNRKGIPESQAKQMINHVSQVGSSVGLVLNFENSILANSFKAHRFSAFAKASGVGVEAEEQLFKAYFTDGKNIDDNDTLVTLGNNIGLDSEELKKILDSDAYTAEVSQDIATARQLRINGVPYFRFNKKHTISGAQDATQFTAALEQVYNEWKAAGNAEESELKVSNGESCDITGNCK